MSCPSRMSSVGSFVLDFKALFQDPNALFQDVDAPRKSPRMSAANSSASPGGEDVELKRPVADRKPSNSSMD